MKSFGTTSSVTAFLTAGMVAVAFAGFSVHGCGGGGDSADAGVVPGTDGGGSGLEDTGGAGGEDTGGNGGEDAGSTDTGLADTGTPDAGELDVGTADAGGGEDGGTGTDAGDGDGGIPGVPEVLATGLKNPYAPVADATHLYWVDSEAGAVTRLAKSGGAPEVFVGSLIAPRGIALDADTVYFATSTFGDAAPKGTISKVGKGGGAPVELAGLQEVPEWVSVDATNVYWYDVSTLKNRGHSVPKAGGAVADFAETSSVIGNVKDMVIDDTTAYILSGDSGDEPGIIISVPLDGSGTPVVLATLAVQNQKHFELGLDATHVYWFDGAAVLRVPKAGGAPEKVFDGQAWVVSLFVSGGTVYFTNDMKEVHRVPTGGGVPEILYTSTKKDVRRLLVEPGAVYWFEGRSPDVDFVRLPLE